MTLCFCHSEADIKGGVHIEWWQYDDFFKQLSEKHTWISVLACYTAMLLINASGALMRNHIIVLQENWVIRVPMFSRSKSLLVPKFDTRIHTKSISHKLVTFQTEGMRSESFIKFSNVCMFAWNRCNWIAFVNSFAGIDVLIYGFSQ